MQKDTQGNLEMVSLHSFSSRIALSPLGTIQPALSAAQVAESGAESSGVSKIDYWKVKKKNAIIIFPSQQNSNINAYIKNIGGYISIKDFYLALVPKFQRHLGSRNHVVAG